jgi:nucleoside-diphosphate-sugar epimerase
MLIGSGLLATAFVPMFSHREDVCIYAAGVSNSSCTTPSEFGRETQRLSDALNLALSADAFVYFGTCSALDPDAWNTPYVLHKLKMEKLVAEHPKHLIVRLPQVAGRTPNPHTLLNFLYARISRSESFQLWTKAKRNIIDVDDVAALVGQFVANGSLRNIRLNIANPYNYAMCDIVTAMEHVLGKRATYDATGRGSDYHIDVTEMLRVQDSAGVRFSEDYLKRAIGKYYGKSR